ncbi:unnamed protein product, partial [Rotaria sp. Silwood2]
MGVFLHDLHQQLKELHQRQARQPLTLYRGQGLSKTDFEKLNKSRLISFNNFLSTSEYSLTALGYGERASELPDMVGIFFEMTIPLSVQSVPFADIQEHSTIKDEKEILFSMHAVFRIDDINEIRENLYEVNLTLTADDDPELRNLTEYIREEVADETGWKRLCLLLVKI